MVLLQKLAVTRTQAGSGPIRLRMHHRREFPAEDGSEIGWRREGDVLLFEASATSRVLFAVEGPDLTVASCVTNRDASQSEKDRNWRECEVTLTFELAEGETRELVVKLPSPMVGPQDVREDLATPSASQIGNGLPGHGGQFHLGDDRPHVRGAALRAQERDVRLPARWIRTNDWSFPTTSRRPGCRNRAASKR